MAYVTNTFQRENVYNYPVTYEAGFLAGRTLYGRLIELQKADVGRKPLDPPPVVQLRLIEIFNLGQLDQYEQEFTGYDAVAVGMCCHVDLLRTPNKSSSGTTSDHSNLPSSLEQGHIDPTPLPDNSSPSQNWGPAVSFSKMIPESALSIQTPFPAPSHHPVSSLDDGWCTNLLVGTRIVEGLPIMLNGEKVMVFAFPDLSVQSVGDFRLRYSVFHIFSTTSVLNRSTGALAECLGGLFTVYSTTNFPGLQESTELSKYLSLHGLNMTIRDGTRRWKR